MTKLMEPHKVQVSPVYICESCKSSHYESLEYVNKIGKILCCCGEVIQLKPISNFKVKPVYVDVKKTSLTLKENMSRRIFQQTRLVSQTTTIQSKKIQNLYFLLKIFLIGRLIF